MRQNGFWIYAAYARSWRHTPRTRARLDRPHPPEHNRDMPRPRRAAHKASPRCSTHVCASGTGKTGGGGHSLRGPLRSRAREMGAARAGRSAGLENNHRRLRSECRCCRQRVAPGGMAQAEGARRASRHSEPTGVSVADGSGHVGATPRAAKGMEARLRPLECGAAASAAH